MDAGRKFFGRDRVIFEITRGVLAPQPQSFSLVGPKLIGKSQFLHHLAAPDGPLLGDEYAAQRPLAFEDGARVVVAWVDCDWQDARPDLTGWIFRQVQRQVREAGVVVDWPAIEGESAHSRRIWRLARALKAQEIRLVLLMDNFDRVFEEQWLRRDTVDELRPLTLEMALVVATEQPLHDLDRDLAASPLFNVMTQLFLGLLDPLAARTWVHAYADDFSGVDEFADALVDLTGMHPFLLRRLGDILLEVREMIAGGALGPAHLPLIRLRMAEHGRLVFETAYRRLQKLPPRVRPESIDKLVAALLQGGLPMTAVQLEDSAALNWTINQAMVICCARGQQSGYQFHTPLFTEYLARRLNAEPAARPQAALAPELPEATLDQFSKTEAALLRYLKVHANQVVSTEQLLAEVWKRPDASNRRVQEAIRRLRLQLEALEPPIGAIENDRGRGYRFVPANRPA